MRDTPAFFRSLMHFPRNRNSTLLPVLLLSILLPGLAAAGLFSRHDEDRLDLPQSVDSPFYGEILFHYYQNNYYKALNDILVAQERHRLGENADAARLLLGNLYLDFGLLEDAEKELRDLIAPKETSGHLRIKPATAEQTWFLLARLYYQTGQTEKAQEIFSNQLHETDTVVTQEYRILQSGIHLRNNQVKKAIALLQEVPQDSIQGIYARYNMAVALLRLGNDTSAEPLFRDIFNLPPGDDEINTIKDKAAIALGYYYLDKSRYTFATQVLQNVRSDSPVSNLALLGLGWAYLASHEPDKALTAWENLRLRKPADLPVLEARYSIGHVYEEAGDLKTALLRFNQAIDFYEQQLGLLTSVIENVRAPQWLSQIAPLEDADADPFKPLPNYVPSTSGHFSFLYLLFSSNDFSQAFNQYRQLQRMNQMLDYWETQQPVFRYILDNHHQREQQLVPTVQHTLDTLPVNQLVSRIQQARARLSQTENAFDLTTYADTAQQGWLMKLQESRDILEHLPKEKHPEGAARKLELLEGVLLWDLEQTWHDRHWQARKALQQTEKEIAVLSATENRLNLLTQKGNQQLTNLEARLQNHFQDFDLIRDRIQHSMNMHGQYLRKLAIERLQQHKSYLQQLLAQSHLAIADLQTRTYIRKREQIIKSHK